MPKFFTLFAAALFLVGTAAFSADTDAELKLSQVVPAENLTAAASEKIEALEKYTADAETFAKSEKKLKRDAEILAIIAQAIAEHEQESPWQVSAPDLRDAAMQLAATKTYEQATPLLGSIKESQNGEQKGAKKKADWAKLAGFDTLMSEVRLRNSQVGRAERKMRRGLDKEKREEAARHMEVLAVIGFALEADTHEVKEKSKIPQWEQYAQDYRKSAAETAMAFRANDSAAVKVNYAKFRKTCTGCHKAFRE